MIITMLTTYKLCVSGDKCPALPKLPTISNTWDNPPGNYLSRLIVSHVALAMGLGQWVIWSPLASAKKCEKLLLGLGLFSCLCLSFVGAICDDDANPQCMGNNTLHSVSAIVFFVLYNINMCVLSCHKKNPSTSNCHRYIMFLLTLLSTLFKIRYVLPMVSTFSVGDQTPVAIFEWCDTFTIITWTVYYICKNRKDFYLQLRVEDSEASSTDTLAIRFPLYNIAWAILFLSFSTLISCFYFLDHAGRIPKGSWPYISDMFVYTPGNWISRWSLVIGSTMSGFTQVCLYYLDGKTSISDKALTALSIISLLGLSGVGCINEKENHTLHIISAAVFFVGYNLYMFLRTLRQSVALEINRWNTFTGFIALLSCVLTFLRFTTSGNVFMNNHFGGVEHVSSFIGPVLEWCDTILIISYLACSIFAYGKSKTQAYGLAIVSKETDGGDDYRSVPLTKAINSINYSEMI
jgi:hypothetical membrane protein